LNSPDDELEPLKRLLEDFVLVGVGLTYGEEAVAVAVAVAEGAEYAAVESVAVEDSNLFINIDIFLPARELLEEEEAALSSSLSVEEDREMFVATFFEAESCGGTREVEELST
jgi:hypothetical protein